jgi:hypothetical protein
MLCPGCPVSFVRLVKAFLVVAQYCDRLRFAVSIGLDVVVYLMLFCICELASFSSFCQTRYPLTGESSFSLPVTCVFADVLAVLLCGYTTMLLCWRCDTAPQLRKKCAKANARPPPEAAEIEGDLGETGAK